MKTTTLSSLAALALLASAGAFAQNLPPCQPGLMYGGCKQLNLPIDTRVMGAGAMVQADLTPYALGVATETLPDGSVRQYAKPYPKTAADLDGDGIPNKDDRFDRDPRFY
ncbi:MAG: hypothetical protein JWQ76_1489 [Ramlibacter sp.]|nr:hypothetical protein [Ramlibacter sp.]